MRVLAGLGPDLPPEQRGLHLLAAPRALALEERGQNPGQQVLTSNVVGDGRADGAGVAAAASRRADDPSGGLRAQVGALALCIGSPRAE